ncbi:hypothetical protein J6590_062699 [Homalodisca vitripennis]|nr:hypothetical protein J6590_062699 [Homalodisca vitripennis]
MAHVTPWDLAVEPSSTEMKRGNGIGTTGTLQFSRSVGRRLARRQAADDRRQRQGRTTAGLAHCPPILRRRGMIRLAAPINFIVYLPTHSCLEY